jgi:hypothetical protein
MNTNILQFPGIFGWVKQLVADFATLDAQIPPLVVAVA